MDSSAPSSSQEQIRVVFDTCIVRQLIHDDPEAIDVEALHKHANGILVSLAPTATVELASQLKQERIPFDAWEKQIGRIDTVIDVNMPIVPCAREGFALAGLVDVSSRDLEQSIQHGQMAWQTLRNIDNETKSDIAMGFETSTDLTVMTIRSEPTAQVVSLMRSSFADMIDDLVSQFSDESASAEEVSTFLLPHMENVTVDTHVAQEKLGLFFEAIAQLVTLGSKLHGAYDPRRAKRQGDTFDILLLTLLACPAIVVTADKPFLNRIQSLKSVQKYQVLSVDEFNKCVRGNNALVELQSHVAT